MVVCVRKKSISHLQSTKGELPLITMVCVLRNVQHKSHWKTLMLECGEAATIPKGSSMACSITNIIHILWLYTFVQEKLSLHEYWKDGSRPPLFMLTLGACILILQVLMQQTIKLYHHNYRPSKQITVLEILLTTVQTIC